MTTHSGPTRLPIPEPPSLLRLLSDGEDPRPHAGSRWECFAEMIGLTVIGVGGTERVERMRDMRYYTNAYRERRELVKWEEGHEPETTDQDWYELAVMSAWQAELLASPQTLLLLAPHLPESIGRRIIDPLAEASWQLEMLASAFEEAVPGFTKAVADARPLLRQLETTRPQGWNQADADIVAWNERYPGREALLAAMLDVLEIVRPVERSETLDW